MKFPFFASFVLFALWFQFCVIKNNHSSGKVESDFWSRESKANSTRRKSLDSLDYIVIPTRTLPMQTLSDKEEVAAILKEITRLSEEKIVNLTGFTNTDLKLKYGAPNLPSLIQYDQNYTLLARTLQKWATLLYEAQYPKEAKTVLEFALETHTDVTASYVLLARLYQKEGQAEKIKTLKKHAEQLHSVSKNGILRKLEEVEASS